MSAGDRGATGGVAPPATRDLISTDVEPARHRAGIEISADQ
jgi:hypothetical protein